MHCECEATHNALTMPTASFIADNSKERTANSFAKYRSMLGI